MTTTRPQDEELFKALIRLAKAGWVVAAYCDRSEHAEASDRDSLGAAAKDLLEVAAQLATAAGVSLVELYARRLEQVERARGAVVPSEFDGGEAAARAKTVRELQSVQAQHDRNYHPDVFGLSRSDQLRHYSFHLSKLTGALARVCEDGEAWEEFVTTRLPDMMLFGIKLYSILGVALPDDPV